MTRRLRLVPSLGGALAAALMMLGTSPAWGQQPSNPAPTPTPAPMPQPMFQRPVLTDELARRWQFDAARKMEDQVHFGRRYRDTLQFAECAQRITPARVASLLDKPLGSPAERRAANLLIRFAPGCLGNSVLVSTRLLRGAAAEAVLETFRVVDPDKAREVSSTRMESFFGATPASDGEKDETAVALARLTQCQVLFAPGLARKLLDVEPGSNDEEGFRSQLVEGTPMCGKVEAKSDLAWLIHRSYLAEALYHWTRSAGGSSRS